MDASQLESSSNTSSRCVLDPFAQAGGVDAATSRANVTSEPLAYAHGESLRTRLERHGNLSPIAAVQLLLPVVEQLRDAHARGSTHAVIDPETISITPLGHTHVRAVLTRDSTDSSHRPGSASAGPATGASAALPYYLPPECIKNSELEDARSHVWSLCVVLYEALVGNLPFEAYTRDGLLFAIAERPPARPPQDVADARLWRIVFAGLCKDPSRRFQTLAQFGYALAAWLDDHDVKVDSAGKSVRRWLSDAPPRESISPNSRALCFTKPTTSACHSRIPPAQGNTLRGAVLVLAIAASVFFLFELTFASPHTKPQAPVTAAHNRNSTR